MNTESNNYDVLLIKPNVIEHLDYNRVDYISGILSIDCYELLNTNSKDIGIIFAKYLNSKNYKDCNALTNICYDTPECLYELCFLDIPKEEKNEKTINQIATLLDITNEQIFGNAILIKTYLPLDTLDMIMISSSKEDIKNILDSRVNHKGVFIDTDTTMKCITFRDIEPEIKKLFDEDIKNLSRIEIPFLKHNFIMYYNKDSLDEENELVRDIGQKKINGEVFIVSMVTDTLYTDISINEVKKILEISKFGENAWKASDNDDNEERDNEGRILIKSKYRILHKRHNQLINID